MVSPITRRTIDASFVGIFDGELCIFEDDKENFKKAVSEIKRKTGTIQNPRYCIFDYFTHEEFVAKRSERTLSERREKLIQVLKNQETEPYLAIVEQIHVKNKQHLEKLMTTAKKKEWEGLILRKDTLYEGKRSANMIKMKKLEREEFFCRDFEITTMRFVEDGQDTEVETLKKIFVEVSSLVVTTLITGRRKLGRCGKWFQQGRKRFLLQESQKDSRKASVYRVYGKVV